MHLEVVHALLAKVRCIHRFVLVRAWAEIAVIGRASRVYGGVSVRLGLPGKISAPTSAELEPLAVHVVGHCLQVARKADRISRHVVGCTSTSSIGLINR